MPVLAVKAVREYIHRTERETQAMVAPELVELCPSEIIMINERLA